MFIEITNEDNLKSLINIKHIIKVDEMEDGTCDIQLESGDILEPNETYKEIKKKLDE